jgi:hypothetical protein
MNVFSIDETEAYVLTVGVLLKSLKRQGWPAAEVEQIQHQIHLEVLQSLDEAREPIGRELAAYTEEFGFDEQALQGLARTEYAIRGFDLAATLNKRRAALCN